MRKLVLGIAAAATLLVALPAVAQRPSSSHFIPSPPVITRTIERC